MLEEMHVSILIHLIDAGLRRPRQHLQPVLSLQLEVLVTNPLHIVSLYTTIRALHEHRYVSGHVWLICLIPQGVLSRELVLQCIRACT
jgi:hypothetical protein